VTNRDIYTENQTPVKMARLRGGVGGKGQAGEGTHVKQCWKAPPRSTSTAVHPGCAHKNDCRWFSWFDRAKTRLRMSSLLWCVGEAPLLSRSRDMVDSGVRAPGAASTDATETVSLTGAGDMLRGWRRGGV